MWGTVVVHCDVQLECAIGVCNWDVQLECAIGMCNWDVQLECAIGVCDVWCNCDATVWRSLVVSPVMF